MTIPDIPGLMQPVLQGLAQRRSDVSFVPLRDTVASRLRLTAQEQTARLPSGGETVFGNRLQWALAYLERSSAVEERQGPYRPGRIGRADGVPFALPETTVVTATRGPASSREAAIATSAGIILERLKHDLLERIHTEPPEFFERLIIALLLALGYGCEPERWRHLGRSGDGGIDGAVAQDVLGLDVIYVQAKRYRPNSTVPVSAVREFAGSLDAFHASKGVFVTTAAFPRSAAHFVSAVPSKIALIDGQVLAELLIEYNIGVKVQEIYEIKQIDETWLPTALHGSTSMHGDP